MAGPSLPTNVGSGTSAGHFSHTNTVHGLVNKLDTTIGSATSGQVLSWDAASSTYKPAAASVGSGASTGSANTFTAHQRFTSGIPHVDVASSVDTTGGSDVGPSLQAMIDAAPTGARFNFPPNSKYRIATTVKVLGSRSQIEMVGPGPRSYNEADSGVRGTLFLADAGITPFQFGDDTPASVGYRGPVVRNLTFREASDAKTAVGISVRGIANSTFENLNFRGFDTAMKFDAGTFDASWGHVVHPMVYQCTNGLHALGATMVITGGNFSCYGGWAIKAEFSGSVGSALRLLGTKIDVQGLGGVYTSGSSLEAHGVGIELQTVNTQFGYKIEDVGSHANSGNFTRIIGGGTSGTSGTGHTGIYIGASCDKTYVKGWNAVNLTTKYTDLGTRSRIGILGEPDVFNATSSSEPHYQINDYANTSLMRLVTGSSTAVHWLLDKAAAAYRFRLNGTSTSDRFAVQDSTGATDFLRIQGDGNVGFGQVATTTTAPAAGGAGALPATPLGYFTLKINGTDRKVAYY